jgi:hypothetical protein
MMEVSGQLHAQAALCPGKQRQKERAKESNKERRNERKKKGEKIERRK